MNKEIKKQWVTALRSGKYKQGKNTLHNGNDEFCCLGVLCDLAFKAGVVDRWPRGVTNDGFTYGFMSSDRRTGSLPSAVQSWAGVTSGNPPVLEGLDNIIDTLSSLNDSGNDFNFIADVIERSL